MDRYGKHLVVLIGLGLAQFAVNLGRLSQLHSVGIFDAPWYYTVARNFAEGHGLTQSSQPFLIGSSGHFQPYAGDYWPIGWPLVLGCLMAFLGTGQISALLACALLSPLFTVLAAVLAGVIFENSLAALVLAGLMTLSTFSLEVYRVTPESTSCYLTALLASLILYLLARRQPRRRLWLAAGFSAFLPAWIRGDGFVVGLAAVACELASRSGRKRLPWLLLGMSLAALPMLAYNEWCFGQLSPAPRSLSLWTVDLDDLYRLSPQASFQGWQAQVWPHWGRLVGRTLLEHLSLVLGATPLPVLLLSLAGLVILWRRGCPGSAVLPLVLALTLLLPCLLFRGANGERTLAVFAVGLAVLAAGCLSSLGWKTLQAAGLVAAVWVYWSHPDQVFLDNYRLPPSFLTDPQVVRLPWSPADLVVSDVPNAVAANLPVRAIGCPSDEVAAIMSFQPTWFVVLTAPGLGQRLRDFRDSGFGGAKVRLVLETSGAQWFQVGPR